MGGRAVVLCALAARARCSSVVVGGGGDGVGRHGGVVRSSSRPRARPRPRLRGRTRACAAALALVACCRVLHAARAACGSSGCGIGGAGSAVGRAASQRMTAGCAPRQLCSACAASLSALRCARRHAALSATAARSRQHGALARRHEARRSRAGTRLLEGGGGWRWNDAYSCGGLVTWRGGATSARAARIPRAGWRRGGCYLERVLWAAVPQRRGGCYLGAAATAVQRLPMCQGRRTSAPRRLGVRPGRCAGAARRLGARRRWCGGVCAGVGRRRWTFTPRSGGVANVTVLLVAAQCDLVVVPMPASRTAVVWSRTRGVIRTPRHTTTAGLLAR